MKFTLILTNFRDQVPLNFLLSKTIKTERFL